MKGVHIDITIIEEQEKMIKSHGTKVKLTAPEKKMYSDKPNAALTNEGNLNSIRRGYRKVCRNYKRRYCVLHQEQKVWCGRGDVCHQRGGI